MHSASAQTIPSVEFHRCEEFEEFNAALLSSSRNSYLSPISPDEFAAGEAYLSEDALTGYRIVDGDLQSVFNNSTIRGAGVAAVLDAIAHGARTLDCFDGFLPGYYRRFGFIEVERYEFDPAYAPEGWDYEQNGRPDVVLMRYHGGNPANLAHRLAVGAIL